MASWLGTAKPKGHQTASGRTRRRERKVATLTQGDPLGESPAEVSRGHSSGQSAAKAVPSEGPKNERTELNDGLRENLRVIRNSGRRQLRSPARTGKRTPQRCSRLKRSEWEARNSFAKIAKESNVRGEQTSRPRKAAAFNRRMRKTARTVVWEGWRA